MCARKKKEWPRPHGITLKEMVAALEWFGVHVSFDALRQTVRQLNVPSTPGRGEGGRGATAYYDFSALWMLATAYRRVAPPKSKFESIAEELQRLEDPSSQPYTLVDFITEEPVEPVRDMDNARVAYTKFICDPRTGLDIRVVSDVARAHWSESGLDDRRLADALSAYKRRQLELVGVPAEIAKTVTLEGSH